MHFKEVVKRVAPMLSDLTTIKKKKKKANGKKKKRKFLFGFAACYTGL